MCSPRKLKSGLVQHPGDPHSSTCSPPPPAAAARAPEGYVTNLFDEIAPQFESHLVHELEYQVPPKHSLKLVRPELEANACVIDLGCGTGLVGKALASAGTQITGVDLSARMLEIAERQGTYAKLEKGELVEVLARTPAGSAQAVLAADVFIYVGDLAAVFAAVARVLAPRGLFAFSVEGLERWHLRPAAHRSLRSVTRLSAALAAQSGLEERVLERTLIRREGRGHAEGWLALFAKSGGGPKARTA